MDKRGVIRESALSIPSCFSSSPITTAPFEPSSPNLFPKLVTSINLDSWELWEFDTFNAKDGKTAIGVSLYRDARGIDKGGFHAELNAIWEDGRKWNETLYFAESAVIQESGDKGYGCVHGVWKSRPGISEHGTNGQESNAQTDDISFTISADCSAATVRFAVRGRIDGCMKLRSKSVTKLEDRLPTTEQEAQLCPDVFYMFPMGPVISDGEITFCFTASPEEQRSIKISPENGWCGGMVRGWSSKPWPTFMNDAYYVVAHVGPYMLQMLRIVGSAFAQHKPRAVARLYYNNELICSANQVMVLPSDHGNTPPEHQHDTVQVTKIFPDENELNRLVGNYRDKNIGYKIDLVGASDKMQWTFEVRHKRAVWSEPTSAPGPEGTGKSGWIEEVSGGAKGDEFLGSGFGGQLQIPVP